MISGAGEIDGTAEEAGGGLPIGGGIGAGDPGAIESVDGIGGDGAGVFIEAPGCDEIGSGV